MQTPIDLLPKAELHLHIEGTFEPELIFAIAERNKVELDYPSIEHLRQAYEFQDLQSFLNLYYLAMKVLLKEQDFVDLANSYLSRAQRQGVVHAEIFFDPQAHCHRGVPFETVIDGLWEAVSNSEKNYGITSKLIMCFLRDLPAEEASDILRIATKFGDRIVAVGLDSAERDNPPSKFKSVFDQARAAGFLTVAHAGEEGPPSYIWEAIDLLKVSRVDHGVRSLEDPKLVAHLQQTQLPLTVCPLSNVKLRVFKQMKEHNIGKMLDLGLRATVNSDDPAYFGGYVADNFAAIKEALHLPDSDLITLARNSFHASFISPRERDHYLSMLERAIESTGPYAPEPA